MITQKDLRAVTEVVRFAYVHVFEKYTFGEGQEAKYSITVLIPKDDKKTLARLQKAYKTAVEHGKEKFGSKFQPSPFVRPEGSTRGILVDADEDARYSGNPDYKGCYVLTVKSKNAPQVLAKETGSQLLTKENGEDIVYSGCYGRISVGFYPYNNMGFGVGCGLNNVKKIKDGDFLGGRTSAEADFAEFDDDDEDLDDLL